MNAIMNSLRDSTLSSDPNDPITMHTEETMSILKDGARNGCIGVTGLVITNDNRGHSVKNF